MKSLFYLILNSKAQIRHIYGPKGVGKTNMVARLIDYYQEHKIYKDGIIYMKANNKNRQESFKQHF